MYSRPSGGVAGLRRSGWLLAIGVLGTVALLAVSSLGVPAGVAAVGAAPRGLAPAVGTAPLADLQGARAPAFLSPLVSTSNVTFRALHLPNGSAWSVAAGSPPVTSNGTISGHSGTIVFSEPNGVLNYTITGPAGFGVAKVEGPGSPSQTSAVINGSETITVFFGAIENLTFTEMGLPASTLWGVSITSALPHGGPGGQSKTSNSTTVVFTVVKGTYHYQVTPLPSSYRATPARGSVGTGHPDKTIRFRFVTGLVVFRETGLAHRTLWQVNITGPVSEMVNSTDSAIRLRLPAGNYTFTVWNFSAAHPTPETGTFSVVIGGGAVVERIAYS